MTQERIRQLNDDLYNMLHNFSSVERVDIATLEAIANSLQLLAREKKETEVRDGLRKIIQQMKELRSQYPTAEINITVEVDGYDETIDILDHVDRMTIDV